MAEDSAYAEQFRRAIEDFWSVRTRQGVRAGQHLDKLSELVGDIFVDEGLAEGNVLRRRQLELSGYYRSEKRWDLLVAGFGRQEHQQPCGGGCRERNGRLGSPS
jgi:hypothetical protein